MAPARISAGIDEAGLGPLLGPLTLGFAAFRAPGREASLWKKLESTVTREPEGADGRIVVADSKVVLTRNAPGFRRLETTALTFLALADPFGRGPRTGRELLEIALLGGRAPARLLARHPWYRCLPRRLPVWAEPEEVLRHAARLERALRTARVQLVDAGVRAVPSGELNDSFDETENKSVTLWRASAEIIEHLWRSFGAEGLALTVDRHGGRKLYAPLIEDLLPDARVQVAKESERLSEYRVRESPGERRMRVAFAQRGEERSFAVALGSCLAKYTREVCMEAFNRYFARLQDGLRPTAGYTTDGRRWLAEAGPAVRRAGLEPGVLVRTR